MDDIKTKIQKGELLTEQELQSISTEVETNIRNLRETNPEEYLQLLKKLNQVFEE